MAAKDIKVLVVDDSVLIREMLSDALQAAPGIQVVGLAEDGDDAVAQFRKVKPDVVTLDVEMPKKNGIETLDEILNIKPVRVIMFSSVTTLGAKTTLDALDLGALDYMEKPKGLAKLQAVREELTNKIRLVMEIDPAKAVQRRRDRRARKQLNKTRRPAAVAPAAVSSAEVDTYADKLIALGISTGGPPALAAMFEKLILPLPPMIIVQHMPTGFTRSFADRLDSLSEVKTKEAATGDILKPNHAYVAPGGKHIRVRRMRNGGRLEVFDAEPYSGHRPSVDIMMNSAAEVYGNRCLGIIMTGMGKDGAEGCVTIRQTGGYVLGQDENSSDVYGMNKVAYNQGGVDRQFNLDFAATEIKKQLGRLWSDCAATSC